MSSKQSEQADAAPDLLLPPGYLDADRPRRVRSDLNRKRPRKIRHRESWMVESHLGGVLEDVPGFPAARAMTHGYGTRLLPTDLLRSLSPDFPLERGPGDPSGLPFDPRLGPPGPLPDLSAENAFSEGYPWTRIPDTSRVPFRSVCHLEITYEDRSEAVGTAWFSAPDILITAGHNVFHAASGRPRSKARTIRVVPGRDGRIGPFGETHGVATDMLPAWRDNADPRADLGMIRIADASLGQATGWFGAAVFTDRDLDGQPLIQSAGYPNRSRPFGTQWYDAGRTVQFDASYLHYRIDTEPGQSGAPIFFTNRHGQRWVVATHVYAQAGVSNLGIRVSDDVFDSISAWSS